MLFREVNERILRLTVAAPPNDIAFVCECSSLDCSTLIPMSREEYRFVRLESLCFVIVPHHLNEEVERVVQASGRYLIVERAVAPGAVSDESDVVLRRRRARARNDARA
ncbi:MAG TPA: hypothetical protein VG265_10275 [Gaiellaceae bacterium]|jgi:hypothetical protein|nr:hypothetical protein [Gaiellaceae bacterium]